MNPILKNIRAEYIVILLFFVLFAMFSMSRCNKTKARLQESASAVALDTIPAVEDTSKVARKPIEPQDSGDKLKPPVTNKKVTSLYVTIDGLNVRTEPKVKAKSLGKLHLYDEVAFMDEVTQETTKLSLGATEANEPWIKIKTKKGTVGWVYGAGVSYYKTKKKGVLN